MAARSYADSLDSDCYMVVVSAMRPRSGWGCTTRGDDTRILPASGSPVWCCMGVAGRGSTHLRLRAAGRAPRPSPPTRRAWPTALRRAKRAASCRT